VNDALVEGEGLIATSDMTDAEGNYVLASLIPGTWTVRPQKTADTSSAVDSMDAVIALEAAAHLRSLTPEERMACDVTGNGSVSALDASRILQFSVQEIPRLPVAVNCDSDFLFPVSVPPGGGLTTIEPEVGPSSCTPGAIVFDPLTTSMTGQDFTAIAVGDCSGNWEPPGGGGASESLEPPVWLGPLHGRDRGLRVPLHLQPGTSFQALDVELRYDPFLLLVQRVRLLGAARDAMVYANVDEPGVIRVALAKLDPIVAGDQPIFVAHFEAVGDGTPANVYAASAKVDGVQQLR
jgi:hypothetical protein